MPKRRAPVARLLRQAGEVAEASHNVIALRSAIIGAALADPAAGNYAEMHRMMTEKMEAATEIGFGLWGAWMDAGVTLSRALISGGPLGVGQAWQLAGDAAAAAAGAALTPLHRRSRANHRRLKSGR